MCVPRIGGFGVSDLQHPLAAPDPGYAGADGFQDGAAVERLEEGVELLGGAGELDRVGLVGDVDDAPAEDVGGALHLLAVLAGGAHLHEHELALDVLALREVDDLHHVDQLVQLLGDLLDHLVGARGDDGHPGHGGVLGRRNGERLDVVAAGGKQARHPRQGAGLVLHEDRKDVAHGYSSSERIISEMPLPPGTIGNTFSVWSVMKSMNTSRSFIAKASLSAPSTSPGLSMRMPTWP